jgi:hypothetical protein
LRVSSLLKTLIACCFLSVSYVPGIAKPGSQLSKIQVTTKVIHIEPLGKGSSRYIYVPFQVLPHTNRISINYNYDRANETNVLDIGIFDSRSGQSKRDVVGFRGWSGGRRNEFFIERETATPGYLAGVLPVGTWRIILGLYRVNLQGVDVTFKIETEIDESKAKKLATSAALSQNPSDVSFLSASQAPHAKSPVPITQAISPRWIKGDLHMHSVHSDGDWTIGELISAAVEAHLDFISITDHNTTSHHAEIDRLSKGDNGLLILRGEEITTYGGHANAWGLPANTLIDFRVQPEDVQGMAQVAAETHRHGALISINHPFAFCAGCSWSYDKDAAGFDAVEIWNGSWDQTDEQSLAHWDQLLQKGRRVTAVASSDSHRKANPIGQPTTNLAINGALSEQAVLKTISAGRVYLTSTSNGPSIKLEAYNSGHPATRSIGELIQLKKPDRVHFRFCAESLPSRSNISFISNGQRIRSLSSDEGRACESLDIDYNQNSYFRIEIRDPSNAMIAMTNPIYIELESRP